MTHHFNTKGGDVMATRDWAAERYLASQGELYELRCGHTLETAMATVLTHRGRITQGQIDCETKDKLFSMAMRALRKLGTEDFITRYMIVDRAMNPGQLDF